MKRRESCDHGPAHPETPALDGHQILGLKKLQRIYASSFIIFLRQRLKPIRESAQHSRADSRRAGDPGLHPQQRSYPQAMTRPHLRKYFRYNCRRRTSTSFSSMGRKGNLPDAERRDFPPKKEHTVEARRDRTRPTPACSAHWQDAWGRYPGKRPHHCSKWPCTILKGKKQRRLLHRRLTDECRPSAPGLPQNLQHIFHSHLDYAIG